MSLPFISQLGRGMRGEGLTLHLKKGICECHWGWTDLIFATSVISPFILVTALCLCFGAIVPLMHSPTPHFMYF